MKLESSTTAVKIAGGSRLTLHRIVSFHDFSPSSRPILPCLQYPSRVSPLRSSSPLGSSLTALSYLHAFLPLNKLTFLVCRYSESGERYIFRSIGMNELLFLSKPS